MISTAQSPTAKSSPAEVVSELGAPTSLEDALGPYMGKRLSEVVASIERPLPEHFPDDLQRRTLSRFRRDLRMVDGARDFIEAFPDTPRCIASSASSDRLALRWRSILQDAGARYLARTFRDAEQVMRAMLSS
jgi:hypothetical protein